VSRAFPPISGFLDLANWQTYNSSTTQGVTINGEPLPYLSMTLLLVDNSGLTSILPTTLPPHQAQLPDRPYDLEMSYARKLVTA
jgi:hypothetical protein